MSATALCFLLKRQAPVLGVDGVSIEKHRTVLIDRRQASCRVFKVREDRGVDGVYMEGNTRMVPLSVARRVVHMLRKSGASRPGPLFQGHKHRPE